jgi:glyoxylate/hydroxypyruvate reductase A
MSGAVLIAITGWEPAPWTSRFRKLAPDRDIRIWPGEIGNPAEISYACVWKPPIGAMGAFPHLKAIFSLGAGVDYLFTDPQLSKVPIARIVDHDLTQRMTEYVVLHVLTYHRRQHLYDAQQRERIWRERDQPAASQVAVGIMGLGELGRDAAEVLQRTGFQVAGWTRTPKAASGIKVFYDRTGLDAFLARTEILVALLPHTPETNGILNLALFRKLKRNGALGGAYLINAGRGKLQVDADICVALDDGVLAGATLDVFSTEPLPPQSPLWSHPKVTVTPHNAAVSDPDALVKNVLRQIDRYEAGLPLEGLVDRAAGY